MILKKFVLLFSSLFLFNASRAQTPNIDSLQKFSYLLITMNNSQVIGNATGFVIKKCNKIYLVSNFHILSNMHIDLTPVRDLRDNIIAWNRIKLRYKKSKSELWSYEEIDLRNHIRQAPEQIRNWPYDIDYIELPLSLMENLNFINIENNSVNDKNIKRGTEIIICGFPVKDHRKEPNYDKRVYRIITSGFLRFDQNIANLGDKIFSIRDSIIEGYSGSPVFSYYTNGDKKKITTIKFSGIMVGHESDNLGGFGYRDDLIELMMPRCR